MTSVYVHIDTCGNASPRELAVLVDQAKKRISRGQRGGTLYECTLTGDPDDRQPTIPPDSREAGGFVVWDHGDERIADSGWPLDRAPEDVETMLAEAIDTILDSHGSYVPGLGYSAIGEFLGRLVSHPAAAAAITSETVDAALQATLSRNEQR